MELALKAPFAGTVTTVGAEAGEQVALGQVLFVVEPRKEDSTVPVERCRDSKRHDLRGRSARRPAEREGHRPGRGQGRVHPPPGRGRAADRRGDQLRAPEVGAPAGRRRRTAGAARRRPGRGAARCWCRTSAAWIVRSSWAAGTSRSSAAPPRPSPNATSTAAWTSSSRCSARSRGPRGGPRRARLRRCASATRGRATSRSPRWSSVGTRLLDLGAASCRSGDTIGVGTPGHVARAARRLQRAGMRRRSLAVHFHDTYGQALSNALAALRDGVTTFDASAGGLGGCPYAESATGNLATEDLVWKLHGLGIETGVDLDELVAPASGWPEARPAEPVAGRDRARLPARLAGDRATSGRAGAPRPT